MLLLLLLDLNSVASYASEQAGSQLFEQLGMPHLALAYSPYCQLDSFAL